MTIVTSFSFRRKQIARSVPKRKIQEMIGIYAPAEARNENIRVKSPSSGANDTIEADALTACFRPTSRKSLLKAGLHALACNLQFPGWLDFIRRNL